MRFIIAFTTSALLAFGLLYGLILAVDPYNKFGYNLFGFETKAVDFARVNKFNQVTYAMKDYTAFILGSSSAHRYLTGELDRLTGLVSYNYSTQSATPEDYLAMVRHIYTKFSPKLIILSVDFEVLNRNFATDDMFYASPLKDYLDEVPAAELETNLFNNSYLTLEAIGDSAKVIWVNLFGKANHAYLADGNHVVEPRPRTLVVGQFDGRPYAFDERRLGYLRTIKALADARGTKIVVLTAPLSTGHLKLVREKFAREHDEFKRRLAGIFGEVWDFQNETIDAFDGLDYFRNSNHATHAFSTIILERIFGKRTAPGIRLLAPGDR
jgi:hypothetical protein